MHAFLMAISIFFEKNKAGIDSNNNAGTMLHITKNHSKEQIVRLKHELDMLKEKLIADFRLSDHKKIGGYNWVDDIHGFKAMVKHLKVDMNYFLNKLLQEAINEEFKNKAYGEK